MTLKSKRLPEEHHEDWFEWRWSLWSELQLAKRQKIAGASEAARRPKARMTGSDVTCLRTPKTRARPKKKSHCRVIKSKSSKCSVAMIEGAAYATDEDTMEEVDLLTTELEPLGVQSEKPLEVEVGPSEKSTTTSSQGLRSSKKKKTSLEKSESSEKANISQLEISE